LRPSLLDYLEGQKRNAKRQANSSAFARSGTSVTAEGVVEVGGLLASFDFDGTGPSDMGTKGWALGSTNGGPAWFIINGHMIFDDLMAQDVLLTAQQATLTTTVADLTTAQATLAATVADLTTAQADIAANVADIATLVGDQLATAKATPATATGWTTATTHARIASTTIAVPAGFSRATVVAMAHMHFQDSAPNGGYVRASIESSAGSEMGGLANLNLGQGASHVVLLTGLSGGSLDIHVDCRSTVASSVTTGRIAQINAFAIFER